MGEGNLHAAADEGSKSVFDHVEHEEPDIHSLRSARRHLELFWEMTNLDEAGVV